MDYQQRIDLDSKSPSSFTGSRIRSAMMKRPMSNTTTIPGDKKEVHNMDDTMIQDDDVFSGTQMPNEMGNAANAFFMKENNKMLSLDD